MLLWVLVVWVVISALVGAAASQRGRSTVGWFLLAILISPLIAGLLLAIFPDLKTRGLLELIATQGTVDDHELERNVRNGRQVSRRGRPMVGWAVVAVFAGLVVYLGPRAAQWTDAVVSKEEIDIARNKAFLAANPNYLLGIRALITARGYQCPKVIHLWSKENSALGVKLEALCGLRDSADPDPAWHYAVYKEAQRVAMWGNAGIEERQNCKTDWTRCVNNSDLVNNYLEAQSAQFDCKQQAIKRAQYGDPKFPGLYFFGTFDTGDQYPKTGIAILIEKDAQYQNGFGAMVHSEVTCTYDLRSKRVLNIEISPR